MVPENDPESRPSRSVRFLSHRSAAPSAELLGEVLDALPDAVLLIDPAGVAAYRNRAAAKLGGELSLLVSLAFDAIGARRAVEKTLAIGERRVVAEARPIEGRGAIIVARDAAEEGSRESTILWREDLAREGLAFGGEGGVAAAARDVEEEGTRESTILPREILAFGEEGDEGDSAVTLSLASLRGLRDQIEALSGLLEELHSGGPRAAGAELPLAVDTFVSEARPALAETIAAMTRLHALARERRAPSQPDTGGARVAVLPREPLKPALPARRARVLAVDDEGLLLTAYQRMLRRSHDVTIASGGREALALLSRDDGFDVILCDLIMPDLSGMGLYREVAARSPELARRFVFVTGETFTPMARRFLEGSGRPWIEKPIAVERLLGLISWALLKKGEGGGE